MVSMVAATFVDATIFGMGVILPFIGHVFRQIIKT